MLVDNSNHIELYLVKYEQLQDLKKMKTILIINGKEIKGRSTGGYNMMLMDLAVAHLQGHYNVLTTVIEDGYDVDEEISKFKQADIVIFQYPVFWFMVPGVMKSYIDDVFQYDVFFTAPRAAYGSGGLMDGKAFMLSTTWNAPLEAFEENGFNGPSVEAALLPMRRALLYCGFSELPHFSAHDVMKKPQIEKDAEAFKKHLNEVFPYEQRFKKAD